MLLTDREDAHDDAGVRDEEEETRAREEEDPRDDASELAFDDDGIVTTEDAGADDAPRRKYAKRLEELALRALADCADRLLRLLDETERRLKVVPLRDEPELELELEPLPVPPSLSQAARIKVKASARVNALRRRGVFDIVEQDT